MPSCHLAFQVQAIPMDKDCSRRLIMELILREEIRHGTQFVTWYNGNANGDQLLKCLGGAGTHSQVVVGRIRKVRSTAHTGMEEVRAKITVITQSKKTDSKKR